MEELDLTKYKTADEVQAEIERRKDTVCHKVKHQQQVKQEKKDTNKSYNEVLKEIQEEVDFELAAVDELRSKFKQLAVGSGAGG